MQLNVHSKNELASILFNVIYQWILKFLPSVYGDSKGFGLSV